MNNTQLKRGGGVLIVFPLLLILFFSFSFAFDKLRIGVLEKFCPFSIVKNQKISGMSVSYWKFIANKLNIQSKYKVYKNWNELLNAFDANQIDVIPYGSSFLEVNNATFAKVYDKLPIVIATQNDISFVPNIKVLKNYPVGVIKHSITCERIQGHLKNLHLIKFNNIDEMFLALENGKIKALIGLLPVVVYEINEHNYLDIRIVGKTGLHVPMTIMIDKKYQDLIPKINQILFSMTPDEQIKIYSKWLKLEPFWTWDKIKIAFIIAVILGILLFLFIVLLEKDIRRRKKLEKELIKAKEEAEIATQAKSEFLANMSHEIRTPLNAMFGFITILKDSKESEENRYKYLEVVEKCGHNLLEIINDILDFSKIEAGKLNIEKVKFNPREEIGVIYSLFASKASEKDITLKIIKKDLDYLISTDPTRLKQIIANLLSNAIKFTPSQKLVKLFIQYNKNKELLYVEVEDEGIGITKEKLNTIFEAFSQADNSTTRKYGGTGLGLSISYKLVEMLGGKLKVKSQEGKGSKFYFAIPAKKFEQIKEKEKIKKEIFNDNYNCHILLVEDNKANQMFMQVILKKLDITFDIANDGMEAIQIFKQNKKKYDLILMDENMPNMNGIEATKIIRKYEQENNLEHIMIIALTANALQGDEKRFILAGMDYYLSKPLDIDKLKLILKKIKK